METSTPTSERATQGGLAIERTYADGSTETQRRHLGGEMTERTWPDGRRERTIVKLHYVTDESDEVSEVLRSTVTESWSATGTYERHAISEDTDGQRHVSTITAGPLVRVERTVDASGATTCLTAELREDMVVCTLDRDGATELSARPAAEMGADPLAVMCRRVRDSIR